MRSPEFKAGPKSNYVSVHAYSVALAVAPWTVAHKAPLSMGFPRQEYWSGLPCLPPGGLPDSGIKPTSLRSPVLVGGFFTTSGPWVALVQKTCVLIKKESRGESEAQRGEKAEVGLMGP